MLTIKANGIKYNAWKEATVHRAMHHISGTFSFTTATSPNNPFPIAAGQAITCLVNDQPVLTGFVDKVTVNYDARQHTVTIEGRDKTADIIDSKVDHKIEFKAPITLEEVARQTLQSSGVTGVTVINEVSGLAPFTDEELISAHIGKSCFEFIDIYACKRQVVPTTDGLGNLVFTRAASQNSGIRFNNLIDGSNNNIKTGNAEYDNSERYYKYTFYSQGNPAGNKHKKQSSKQLTNRTGTAYDNEIRKSRQYHEIAESSHKEENLSDRALWEKNIRKAKSFTYTVTVAGHSPTEGSAGYKPNTLVTVNDDFSNVYQDLIISEVEYRHSVNEGSITEVIMLTPEAFSIIAQEDAHNKDKKDKGDKGKGKGKGDPTIKSNYDNSVEAYYKNK